MTEFVGSGVGSELPTFTLHPVILTDAAISTKISHFFICIFHPLLYINTIKLIIPQRTDYDNINQNICLYFPNKPEKYAAQTPFSHMPIKNASITVQFNFSPTKN